MPNYVTAIDVVRSPAFALDKPPERWQAGSPFESLDLRPGRVVLIGGPPGASKTTLSLHLATNVLERQPDLRCVIGNVETAPSTLVEKLMARFAGVPLDAIMNRQMLVDERARIEAAKEKYAEVLGRIGFLTPPFTLPNLLEAMKTYKASLAVVDYCQRFTGDDAKDGRLKLDTFMGQVRELANAGAGVVLISSVARQKTSNGSSTYKGLSMAAFRGSSELEFGADSAYILDKSPDGVASLDCVKQRFGAMRDLPLRFDGPYQSFDVGQPLDAFDAAQLPKPKRKRQSA